MMEVIVLQDQNVLQRVNVVDLPSLSKIEMEKQLEELKIFVLTLQMDM